MCSMGNLPKAMTRQVFGGASPVLHSNSYPVISVVPSEAMTESYLPSISFANVSLAEKGLDPTSSSLRFPVVNVSEDPSFLSCLSLTLHLISLALSTLHVQS